MTRPRSILSTSLACVVVWCILSARPVTAGHVQLITNGGFESGDFTGWSVQNQLGTADYASGSNIQGSFFIQGSSGTTPVSGSFAGTATIGPASGNNFALSDSTAPGVHALIQSFTVPNGTVAATLSFDMYTYDWYGAGAVGTNLDPFGSGPNQHVQVDLLNLHRRLLRYRSPPPS